MSKLALIGDSALEHYAVAGRLWELISVVIDKKFRFSILPLSTDAEVLEAFEGFRKDRSFVGFNIVAPWKEVLAPKVDELEGGSDLPLIDTVYRRGNEIVGAKTNPLAAQRALEAEGNLYKCKSVLIIGTRGAGLTIAHHFFHNLDKKTYLYDPSVQCPPKQKDIICLTSLLDVAKREYDLIINATPLGRYYFDRRIEAFTSPLDLETLGRVSHKNTIVQETNYIPDTTLLLQKARHLELQVVTGDLMLVFEAVESLKRFFGITLDENTVRMLVEEIGTYISEREAEILEQNDSFESVENLTSDPEDEF